MLAIGCTPFIGTAGALNTIVVPRYTALQWAINRIVPMRLRIADHLTHPQRKCLQTAVHNITSKCRSCSYLWVNQTAASHLDINLKQKCNKLATTTPANDEVKNRQVVLLLVECAIKKPPPPQPSLLCRSSSTDAAKKPQENHTEDLDLEGVVKEKIERSDVPE